VWNSLDSVKALETSAKTGLGKAVADRMPTQGQTDQMFSYVSGNWVWEIANMGVVGMGCSRDERISAEGVLMVVTRRSI